MNHKHVQVVIEDMQYSPNIDEWTAINDLIDYTECVQHGNAESHYEKCLLYKSPTKVETDKTEKDFYMTVGDMRRAIQGLDNDAKVYYQRIEDVYFNKHGWSKSSKFTIDPDYDDPDDIKDEWTQAFDAYKAQDGDLHITAHY